MNETTFSRANGLYKAGDYRGALRKYTDCLRDEQNPLQPGEYGALYHHIGNCLMKMKNPSEAIRAYLQSQEDTAYTSGASLHTNLGKAYSSMKEYDKAIDEFQAAIDTPGYDARYKALLSLGNIQMKMGDSADAGRNFREAALDENNPDPAKALLNLGVCFMSLGRPEEAIASYESAKQFDTKRDTKNALLSSMGQAYAANNQPEEAVECFREVTADGTFQLSDSASVDYSRCISIINKK
ncbi:MAG: tetratricopeptide repeat protein, partial [Phoenicibacter congonensis]|nr:tetratricopeptide repeat protein [Phoenicibacter congonensis]